MHHDTPERLSCNRYQRLLAPSVSDAFDHRSCSGRRESYTLLPCNDLLSPSRSILRRPLHPLHRQIAYHSVSFSSCNGSFAGKLSAYHFLIDAVEDLFNPRSLHPAFAQHIFLRCPLHHLHCQQHVSTVSFSCIGNLCLLTQFLTFRTLPVTEAFTLLLPADHTEASAPNSALDRRMH